MSTRNPDGPRAPAMPDANRDNGAEAAPSKPQRLMEWWTASVRAGAFVNPTPEQLEFLSAIGPDADDDFDPAFIHDVAAEDQARSAQPEAPETSKDEDDPR